MSGPRSSDSQTQDFADGIYEWRPSATASAQLKTLLDGLLDGSITDEVVLGINNAAETGAVITNFGASKGGGNQQVLTINETEFPALTSITLSATLASTTSAELYQLGTQAALAVFLTNPTAASHTFPVSSGFTDSTGIEFNLVAYNADVGAAGTRNATCRVRLVRAPSITSFTATNPFTLQGPFINQQAVYLSGVIDGGDPATTWTLSQSGSRTIQHLPTHVTPAALAATGTHRERLQVAGGGGGYTDVTLTGAMTEAGSAVTSTHRITLVDLSHARADSRNLARFYVRYVPLSGERFNRLRLSGGYVRLCFHRYPYFVQPVSTAVILEPQAGRRE